MADTSKDISLQADKSDCLPTDRNGFEIRVKDYNKSQAPQRNQLRPIVVNGLKESVAVKCHFFLHNLSIEPHLISYRSPFVEGRAVLDFSCRAGTLDLENEGGVMAHFCPAATSEEIKGVFNEVQSLMAIHNENLPVGWKWIAARADSFGGLESSPLSTDLLSRLQQAITEHSLFEQTAYSDACALGRMNPHKESQPALSCTIRWDIGKSLTLTSEE